MRRQGLRFSAKRVRGLRAQECFRPAVDTNGTGTTALHNLPFETAVSVRRDASPAQCDPDPQRVTGEMRGGTNRWNAVKQ
jgi:hypothetical protein